MNRLIIGLVVGLALVAVSGRARLDEGQPARFRQISVADGLRHHSVYSVRQDSTGFVWMATEGGLVRYDGQDFTHFGHRPFLDQTTSSQDANYVFEDQAGYLWVGTWGGGVERYDPRTESFTHFRYDADDPRSLSDDRVHTVFQTRDGTLWIATYRGLNRLETDRTPPGFRRYLHRPEDDSSLAHDRVWSLSEGPLGNLWIGTDRGLDRLDPASGEIRHFRHDPEDPASLNHDIVRVVYHDRSGILWVGTQDGLDRLDTETGRFTHYIHLEEDPTSLGHNVINALLEDSQGDLWVGTHFGGLDVLDRATGEFRHFRADPADPFSLGHDDVRALWEGNDGMLWIATRGGGVSLLDLRPLPFVNYGYRSGDPRSLSDPLVLSIFEEESGTLWVGTLKGLDRIERDGGPVTHFVHDEDDPGSLSADPIQAVLRDRSGELWVGTYDGLNRYDDRTGRFDRYPDQPGDPRALTSHRIQALLEDRSGSLWVGTRSGVNRLGPERRVEERFLRSHEGLSDDFVWTLYEDQAGAIWIGTDVGGLNRLDPSTGEIRRFRHDPHNLTSLSNDRVRALYEDPDRRQLWVGTRFGLNRLDLAEGTFAHFFESDGLPDASIQGLIGDGQGHLWLSSNLGLARFDLETEMIRRFDIGDGIQGRIFNRSAYHLGPDGRVFFGGSNGLTSFYPSQIAEHRSTPPLVVADIRIFNRPAVLGRAPEYVERLDLSWKDNFFTLEFAALEYTQPGRRQYSYRLQGFDPEWIESGNRRFASYTNVEPGNYLFQVRVSDPDGGWSDSKIEMPVSISAPYWKTTWFRLLILASALLALATLHAARTRRLRRDQRRLEALVDERTEEVERQKAHLEATNEIVQLINEETEFSDMLASILEGVCYLRRAPLGLALVYDSVDRRLEVRAHHGWNGKPEAIEVARMDRFLEQSKELRPGIFYCKTCSSELLPVELGTQPRRLWTIRIDPDDRLEGYLLFARVSDEESEVEAEDSRILGDLRGHMASAFVKGRMLEELTELNRKKNEFLGIAAHDLRSPLSGIRSHADLLSRQLEEDRFDPTLGARFLSQIRDTSDQMLGLISDLLNVATIETGRMSLCLELTAWTDLLEERGAIHRGYALDKGIALLFEATPDLPRVLVDRSRITEVIDNLLSNAIKYTEPGGKVRLAAEAVGKEVVTHVHDTGLGLEPSEIKEVFSGKKLSPRPTAGESSTGLGLIIAKRIVDLHGGRLWVESQKGEGSTFSFSLGLAQD